MDSASLKSALVWFLAVLASGIPLLAILYFILRAVTKAKRVRDDKSDLLQYLITQKNATAPPKQELEKEKPPVNESAPPPGIPPKTPGKTNTRSPGARTPSSRKKTTTGSGERSQPTGPNRRKRTRQTKPGQ